MNLGDLTQRVLARLDDANGLGYYSRNEIAGALNWAQRYFCLRTLCLQATNPLTLQPGSQFVHMLAHFPRWVLPLYIRYSNRIATAGGVTTFGNLANPMPGPKLRPVRLYQMNALAADWQDNSKAGNPLRYGHLGGDFLFFDRQIGNPPPEFIFTYNISPPSMAAVSDSPLIPDEDQPSLIDGALAILRMKEGGQEFQKAQTLWSRFLDVADMRAEQVRHRNRTMQYDYLPPELARADKSRESRSK